MLIKSKIEFELDSPLKPDVIISNLERNIAGPDKKSVRKEYRDRAYVGVVNDSKFKLERLIEYRNGFLPVIYGEISESKNNGTGIKTRFELNPLTKIIMYSASIVFMVIGGLIALVKGSMFPLIPIIGILAFNSFGLFIFHRGVLTSKDHLIQITKGKVLS